MALSVVPNKRRKLAGVRQAIIDGDHLGARGLAEEVRLVLVIILGD
jgi:hypothetical protein